MAPASCASWCGVSVIEAGVVNGPPRSSIQDGGTQLPMAHNDSLQHASQPDTMEQIYLDTLV